MDKLWEQLGDLRTLKAGWHLSRNDICQDFVEDLYSADAFATQLDDNRRELANRISTDTYRPGALLRIEVPKGSLGTRPGSVPLLRDRVAL